MSYQQPMAQSMNGYGAAVGPQLSDDQFLQWGQTAQPPNQYNDSATYQSMNSMPPSTSQSSNQLTRRPGNQIATRAKQTEGTNNMWLDGAVGGGSNGNTTSQQADSVDLDELERQAAVAKKEAQGKRKQIPPFVQKLRRYDF
jgi:heat shock transcription factor